MKDVSCPLTVAAFEGMMMDEQIVVRYVKIGGKLFEEPVPKFGYETKIGVWMLVIEDEAQVEAVAVHDAQQVEVEVGMQFGTLRDSGKLDVWRSSLPNAFLSVAKIVGSDPMRFVER